MSTIRSRRWLWFFLLIPSGFGLARLRLDVEVLNLLPDDSPVVQGLKLYQQNFSNARELILTLKSPEAELTERSARALAEAMRRQTDLIADATWQFPWLEHPGQAAELIAYLWLNQPPEAVGQLDNRLRGANLTNTLVEAREALATSLSPNDIASRAYDPFGLMQLPESATSGVSTFNSGQEMFASPDGTFRVIFIQATTGLENYRECIAWLDRVKAVEAAWRAQSGLGTNVIVSYTGRPAFVAEIASGMERDMTASVAGTMVIIALLFWWAHRRLRPLIWLLTLLVLILGATLSIGGLIFGTLNVISLGFAAILLGLGVDYGLVLYQEAQANPQASPGRLRRLVGPGIIWSAVTTAGAFATLNLSGLPGLGQLGSLVAIGITLAAIVMLSAYLSPLPGRPPSGAERAAPSSARTGSGRDGAHPFDAAVAPGPFGTLRQQTGPVIRQIPWAWALSAFIPLTTLVVLSFKRPDFDSTANSLRPKNSAAYAAIEEIKRQLGRAQDPLWLVVPGRPETEVARRLEEVHGILTRAVSDRVIRDFTSAAALWPRPQNLVDNRQAIERLLRRAGEMSNAALAHGFASNSLAFTEGIFHTWRQAIAQTNVFWPTNEASRWTLDKVISRAPGRFVALALIYPIANPVASASEGVVPLTPLSAQLARAGALLSGWELLGWSLFDRVVGDLPRVLLSMLALLLISLWLAFRRLPEMLLSLGTLLFAGLCLYGVMALAHWSWNLLNMMALPLLLGAGVDYSIHMQLALRRHGGDLRQVRHGVGRALFLCGGTTVAAFGSLAWSNNAGMAGLGRICSVGILCTMLTAVGLLPAWWKSIAGRKRLT